jgi:integrase
LLALGHKKLDSIQPTHLIEFYKNLSEGGVRLDYKYKLKENILSETDNFRKKLDNAPVNSRTVSDLINGSKTDRDIAEKISSALNKPLQKVFDIVDKEKKLSEKSISHHHRLISAMLTTAVQWQLILSNPCERVKPPKVERKEAEYYNVAEVLKMMELLENEPLKYRVMITIVIFCGLRRGELTNLEWSDIDFEEETISVSKQLQYLPELGIYEIKSAKTDAGNRTVSIPAELTELLQEYKSWQDEEKIRWGNKWIESGKLFTKENGEPIFPDTPSQWFNRFIKRHNLPPLTFHQLRHTNASLLIGEGVDVATVSKRLGHADKTVTLRTYTHALKEHDREAADKLANLIKNKK